MTHNVLVHVTGGIAAYKACEVVRLLQGRGCDVRVCMTSDALRFVGAVTFEALSSHPVATSLYDYAEGPIPHIELSAWADVQLVVPATANIIAKMAAGIADDIVSATLLAANGPVVIAPAMNTRMWDHGATQSNLTVLQQRGIRVVRPATGRLACGDSGAGKLADARAIVDATVKADVPRDLVGVRFVITAGPTHEAIDAVRYIANASSGKMGYAIAAAAASRGAVVTLISGPVSLDAPPGAHVIEVISAAEMYAAAVAAFNEADVAICAAAVADYTPCEPTTHKRKKDVEPLTTIRLVETQDILTSLSAMARDDQLVVGFAAETDHLIEYAREKLSKKGCDLIVANDVSRADSTFGSNTNTVTFVTHSALEPLPTLSKEQVADELLDRVASIRNDRVA